MGDGGGKFCWSFCGVLGCCFTFPGGGMRAFPPGPTGGGGPMVEGAAMRAAGMAASPLRNSCGVPRECQISKRESIRMTFNIILT